VEGNPLKWGPPSWIDYKVGIQRSDPEAEKVESVERCKVNPGAEDDAKLIPSLSDAKSTQAYTQRFVKIEGAHLGS